MKHYTLTVATLTVMGVIFSGLEKYLSVIGQTRLPTSESNALPGVIFQRFGLVNGHIIVFAISVVASLLLFYVAILVQSVGNDRNRKICMGILLIAIIAVLVQGIIVTINNAVIIFHFA